MTGGGTAGHVNPALAIADIIAEKEPDSVIEYVGTKTGIEGTLVSKRQMKLHEIRVQGLSRSLSLSNLKAAWNALHAVSVCKKILRKFRPDVVIGTGGYVCWPLIRAASSLGVPSVLHESNAEPGFAVKMLKNRADLILVNFEATKEFLKGVKARVERVGMPVDKRFPKVQGKKTRTLLDKESVCNGIREKQDPDTPKCALNSGKETFRIVSFGGSLGAHTMNLCAIRLMEELIAGMPQVTVEHACGTREFRQIEKMFREKGLDRYPNLILTDYIYDMPLKMTAADLIICRSGAATLAEIAAGGKAAILIPSPNVTNDQQRKNAMLLSEQGAALVLDDSEAEEKIVETVRRLLSKDGKRELTALAERAVSFAVEDCNEAIYRYVKEITENRKR